MSAIEVEASALRSGVSVVRCGQFKWSQAEQIERRRRAVIAWLATEESASDGHYSVLIGKKGENRDLIFLFDDVNTAFNTKMRWGS